MIDINFAPHVDDVSDTSSFILTPSSTFSESSGSSLENNTIVIVGAGSIGLWIAYHLAKVRPPRNGSHNSNIIVIEAADTPFGETSRTCTGCIHYNFIDATMNQFGKYSFSAWKDAAVDNELKHTAGLRFNSIFGLTKEAGDGRELLPDWLRTNDSWNVNSSFLGADNAMVNPIGLGKWLARACSDLGVQILTSTTVTSVELNEHNNATAVNAVGKHWSEIRIPCHAFVLAGGPWTPTVYKQLFPLSSIHIEQAMEAGDWVVFANQNKPVEKSIAFVGLNEIVGEKLEFASRNDGTIWSCGSKDLNGTLPPLGSTGRPDPKRIAELIGRAYRFLKVKGADDPAAFEELDVVALGRAFRPVTLSGRPMMSRVAPELLVQNDEPGVGPTPGNVFLCWGHGSWGLALGPGTGKLMSQLIRGEAADLDLSPYQIPSKL